MVRPGRPTDKGHRPTQRACLCEPLSDAELGPVARLASAKCIFRPRGRRCNAADGWPPEVTDSKTEPEAPSEAVFPHFTGTESASQRLVETQLTARPEPCALDVLASS